MGFALAGVCEAAPTAHREAFEAWLGAGKHGSMGWLAEHVAERCDPARVLEGARSVLVVADRYAERGAEDEALGPGRGRIARYARGRDYHTVMKKRLHGLCDALRAEGSGAEFRAFVDTAPVLEREHAARAGLGWIGKHTLLIHPRMGSYFLLGGVLTTAEWEASAEQRAVADHCGTCTRCIDACPTKAIAPYSVDASRCVSYLTIERRGPIEERFFGGIGEWLFGCDICQEVCPHNSARPPEVEQTSAPHEAYRARRGSFDLLEVLGWDEEARREAFEGSALKRARLDMMKRNALIVAGNELAHDDLPALRERIAELAGDDGESELVRGTARAVLARLSR